jgi:predicted nucleotidyltransferase
MNKQTALSILAEHREQLKGYSVKNLSLFGSTARDEASENSDVDILVEFDDNAQVGLFGFIELKQYLEGILKQPVDLGTIETLKDPIRKQVLKEAVRVA